MCILIFEDWFGDRHHLPQQTRVLYNTQNLFDIKIKWYNLCDVDPSSLATEIEEVIVAILYVYHHP